MTYGASPLLDVRVMALVFDASPEAILTIKCASEACPTCACFAVVDEESGQALRQAWIDDGDSILAVLYADQDERFAVACDIIHDRPSGPLAVLTHKPERTRWRFGRKSDFEDFVEAARRSRSDVQVHVCSSDWRTRGPRVR
jgi:hypothetical protein